MPTTLASFGSQIMAKQSPPRPELVGSTKPRHGVGGDGGVDGGAAAFEHLDGGQGGERMGGAGGSGAAERGGAGGEAGAGGAVAGVNVGAEEVLDSSGLKLSKLV